MTGGSTCNTCIAAVSNLSTAYNLANISLALVLFNSNDLHASTAQKAALSSSVFAGAIIGQLTFGYIGDCLGRGPAMQITMAFSVVGAFLSALVYSHDTSTVFTQLSLFRFVMGVGVGGVYPLAATVAAESSGSAASRGRNAALVFSAQGIGQILVPILAFFAWHMIAHENGTGPGGNFAWRFLLGFGCIPGLILAPFKASSVKYKPVPVDDKGQDDDAATSPAPITFLEALSMEGWSLVPQLLGTAGTWFL